MFFGLFMPETSKNWPRNVFTLLTSSKIPGSINMCTYVYAIKENPHNILPTLQDNN